MILFLIQRFYLILQVLEGSENDEKAITAMGLLNTMETILTVMEDHEELHAQLEPVVLQAVHHIFSNAIMEFYEEALSLTCDLTTTKITENMWKMLNLIYQVLTHSVKKSNIYF